MLKNLQNRFFLFYLHKLIKIQNMKKLLYLFSAVALMLTSCSSDDDNDSTQPVLLKQLKITVGNNTFTNNFNYNGSKIISIVSSNGSLDEFTYTGDLITKIKSSESGNPDFTESFFEYNSNGEVVTQRNLYNRTNPYGSKSVYVHNSDGTISYNFYLGNLNSQTEFINSGKLFIGNNGEIIKVEEYNSSGAVTERYEYTFDSKNNAVKNVTGYNKLPLYSGGKYFNVLTSVSLGGYSSDNYTYQYQYNANNYPTSAVFTNSNGNIFNYTFTYNQ
jgi:hypothetical protein